MDSATPTTQPGSTGDPPSLPVRRPHRLDPGIVVLVLVLLVIPVAVWQLVAMATAGGSEANAGRGPARSPAPRAEPAEQPPLTEEQLALRQKLAAAERELSQVRLEAAHSGIAHLWDDVLAEKQRAVGGLRARLAESRAANR